MNRIDLDYFSLRFGVFVDAIRRQIRIELPAASKVFDYSGISETDGTYVFEGTPLRIRIESDTRMVCSWTGDDSAFKGVAEAGAADAGDAYSDEAATPDAVAPSRAPETSPGAAVPARPPPVAQAETVESYEATGSNGSAVFVVLAADPLQAIRLEALRRQNLLVSFVDGVGGSWSVPVGTGSATAQDEALPSRLEIRKNGRFSWKGRGGAAAALFPADAGEDGDLAFRLSCRSRHLLFLERRVLDPFRPGRFQPSQMVQFPLQAQSLGPRPRRRFRLAGEPRRASRRSADRSADPAAGDGVAHGLRAIHRGRLGLRRARNTEGRESLPRGRHAGPPSPGPTARASPRS